MHLNVEYNHLKNSVKCFKDNKLVLLCQFKLQLRVAEID